MHRTTAGILQCSADRADVEQSFLVETLRETVVQMYPENKESFGPMFFAYLTNAARLVMGDTEMTATLLDVPRVVGPPATPEGLLGPAPTTPRRE